TLRRVLSPGAGALFVERRWNSGTFLQNGEPKPHQSSLRAVAFDGHGGRGAVKDLEPLGDVGHADAGATEPIRPLDELRRAHAYAVVFDFNDHVLCAQPAPQVDTAAFHLRRQAVLDGVLD